MRERWDEIHTVVKLYEIEDYRCIIISQHPCIALIWAILNIASLRARLAVPGHAWN
jgi:hypothetical protein